MCLHDDVFLTDLHLSSNGLTGSLPKNLTISESLTDVSLSHNQLTCTIPDTFQSKPWNRLDLSFNRISGTLDSSRFNTLEDNSARYLEENWLSGVIPKGLIGVKQVNILNGNIFGCYLSKIDVPQYDPNFSNYKCGSTSFDACSLFRLVRINRLVNSYLINVEVYWREKQSRERIAYNYM